MPESGANRLIASSYTRVPVCCSACSRGWTACIWGKHQKFPATRIFVQILQTFRLLMYLACPLKSAWFLTQAW